MISNKYFNALYSVAKRVSPNNMCLRVDENTFESDDLRPMYYGGYILNLYKFNREKCSCVVCYDVDGYLMQEEHEFGIKPKFDEYLYHDMYNYFIGEEEMTEEEYLEQFE